MFDIIRNKNSILGRLIQSISVLISLVIIFSSILYSVREYYYLNQALINEISVMAKIIGFDTSAKDIGNKDKSIQKIINSLQTQKAINAALITDIDNKKIAEYSSHGITINLNNNNSYTKTLDIVNSSNTKVGYFYIHANYSELDAFIINAIYISSWILLISIIISSIFAYFYSRSLCNPLIRLRNNMHKVIDASDYNIKSIIRRAPDEIMDLNNIFNNMIDKIAHRNKEISEYNQSLQQDIEKKDMALQESYEQLHFAAYHDELTRLPNLKLFRTILLKCLNNAKKNNQKFAVLFIDVDNFKQVNDTFGHDIGDELLKEISNVFSNVIRKNDLVVKNDIDGEFLPISRLGGDEFTIILNNIESIEDVNHIAERLKVSVYNIKKVNKYNVHVSISIGVAIYPEDGQDTSTLLKHADAAMYHAKSHGKNKYQYYNNDIGKNIKNRIKTEAYLADAIINDEFLIKYQPKLDLITGKTKGVEALIRWDHPEHGIIGPNEFINISEDSELICAISDIVIEKICEDIKKWKDLGIDYGNVAINISIRQFKKENFVENICSIIAKNGIKFNQIELELTEGMLINNIEEAICKLKLLSEIGFITTIDDFGTGYSSFKYLSNLPVDNIKIDKSFVMDMDVNNNNLLIVKSIINLAHSLNMQVVAEGVERIEIVELLNTMNCECAQGYYYSKPLSNKEITEYIKTTNNQLSQASYIKLKSDKDVG